MSTTDLVIFSLAFVGALAAIAIVALIMWRLTGGLR
jgi:hypothetical protein